MANNLTNIQEGDTRFYIKFRGFEKVNVVGIRNMVKEDSWGVRKRYDEYLIEFKDGKRKIVTGNKLF